jgi:organic hydroperoxide reductase OsmC/OhrA
MQQFPHYYTVSATAETQGDIELGAAHLSNLSTAPPAEFDGPGDRWSPETLLIGALGDCFAITFRGIARVSKLPWTSLRCDVTGTLERIDRAAQFTAFELHARLDVPAGTNVEHAQRVLEKAEHNCLITNSLKGAVHLVTDVDVATAVVGELARHDAATGGDHDVHQ